MNTLVLPTAWGSAAVEPGFLGPGRHRSNRNMTNRRDHRGGLKSECISWVSLKVQSSQHLELSIIYICKRLVRLSWAIQGVYPKSRVHVAKLLLHLGLDVLLVLSFKSPFA